MQRTDSDLPSEATAPAVALTATTLAHIESELARCVGPVAGMLVRRAAQRHATAEALVLALAPSIEGADERKGFVRACHRETRPRRGAAPMMGPERKTKSAPAQAPAVARAARRREQPIADAALPALPATSIAPAAPLARAPMPAGAAAPTPRWWPPPAERRKRSAARARTLSPHWRGVATRGHRDLALLPLWAAAALAGALLLATWWALNAQLDARARPLFARLAALPAALHGDAAAAPAGRPRLAALLTASTPAGPVKVRDEAQRSLVTLPADTLFTAGSTRLDARADELLQRVVAALRQVRAAGGGELLVIGHGAAAAPSLQHPSNWHFTRARAQAVADALAARGLAPARAEGRAEFEPRAGTPRDRIEIELRLPRPDEGSTP